MKKTYQAPEVHMYQVSINCLIDSSPYPPGTGGDGNIGGYAMLQPTETDSNMA